MKIAFINPPFLPKFSRGQRSPGVTKGGTLYYPYWLALACVWTQKKGNEVWLFDFVARGDLMPAAIKKVKDFTPQLAVIETSTSSIFNDIMFAKVLKRQLKNCFILLVGTHPTAMPKWTINQAEEIDAVAVGEYDQTVVDLASVLASEKPLAKVAGLVFRQGQKFISSPPRELLKNLDDFPFASEIYGQFISPKDYFFAAADYPMAMIITGRGCPYGCFFCLWPQVIHGLQYRFRSPENVTAEFAFISQNLPEIKEVVIEDDTFTADIGRVRKICRLLIKQGNTLKWSTNARVHLDLETMRLMKKAGCRLLIVGYESGSQEVLDGMGKKIKLADSWRFAQNAKKTELLVHGCFMVGNPGESQKTMEETLQFAIKLNPDSAQFYPLFVYPGTRAYQWAKKHGYLQTTDFRRWLDSIGRHNCVIDLPHLSARQMVDFCNRAYWHFHLRPRYLFKKLIQFIRQPVEGRRTLRAAVNFFKNQR